MNVKINSFNIIEFKGEDNINTSQRVFSNSDLDKSENISKDKEENKNIIIYDIKVNNNKNENEVDNDNIEDDDISEEEKKNKVFHYKFIQELKNDGFIFIKDFPEQMTNENNKDYANWLIMIYKNIFIKDSKDKNKINNLKINNKFEIPDFSEIFKNLKDDLFFCINPECKSIIYISKKYKDKFNIIQNLYLEDYDYEYKTLNGQQKIRCPLCLKYKCIYCNKLSTIKYSLCCPIQSFKTCSESKKKDNMQDKFILLLMIIPLLRVGYFGYMISFPLFRTLTKPNKLL